MSGSNRTEHMVYAPCEHGYWDRHLKLEGGWCDGRRSLGTVENIERWKAFFDAFENAEGGTTAWLADQLAKAAAYDNAEKDRYWTGLRWMRPVEELEEAT